MAKQNTPTAWKAVEQERVQIDEGDILQPLRKVAERYEAKAAYLRANVFGEDRKAVLEDAEANTNAAKNVRRLLGEPVFAGFDLAERVDFTPLNTALENATVSAAALSVALADSELGRAEDDGGRIAG